MMPKEEPNKEGASFVGLLTTVLMFNFIGQAFANKPTVENVEEWVIKPDINCPGFKAILEKA